VKVTYLYLWSMGISLVLLTFFAVFFKYARTGIFMRAVADHQTAAQSMGISVKRVFALSWCIAAVVSSIGGILIGNIGGVGVELSHIGLKVLPAVIFGGSGGYIRRVGQHPGGHHRRPDRRYPGISVRRVPGSLYPGH